MPPGRQRPVTVRVVGPVPPPIHGAARVTDLVRRRLADRPDVSLVVVDTGDEPRGPVVRLRTLLLGLLGVALGRRGAVYVGGAGGELLWYQAVVVGVARLRGHRTVFHHHNYRPLYRSIASMRLLTRLGGRGLTHVVLDDVMADDLRARYASATTVLVCSNAGLLASVGSTDRTTSGADDDALVLGHLSNLTLEKGLGVVVDLFEALRSAGSSVRLRLGGPAASDDAAALLERVAGDWPGDVDVLGPVDPERVEEFYRGIDLFVFPSTYVQEAEPLVVLEAMRVGVAATAFDVGTLRALVPADLLVERDEDLPARLVPVLREAARPSAAEREQTARRFEVRRDASLASHERLLRVLLGT